MTTWRTILSWEVYPEYSGAELEGKVHQREWWEILNNHGHYYVAEVDFTDKDGIHSKNWTVGKEEAHDPHFSRSWGLWPWRDIVRAREIQSTS